MNKIYLCGPIKDISTAEANEWREKAKLELEGKDFYVKLGDKIKTEHSPMGGFSCLDPMRRQFNDEDQLGVNEIVQMDKKDVEDADILLVNYNVARGRTTLCGTSMEVFYAHELGKYIVAFSDLPPEKWSPWMIYHCTRILPSLDDAIEYIKKHF